MIGHYRFHTDYIGVFNTWSACPDDGKQLGAERKAAESCIPLCPCKASGGSVGGCGGEYREIFPGGLWHVEMTESGDDGKQLGACGKRLRVAFHCAPARPPEELWGGVGGSTVKYCYGSSGIFG